MKKITVVYVGWGARFPLAQLADDGRDKAGKIAAERGTDITSITVALPAAAGTENARVRSVRPGSPASGWRSASRWACGSRPRAAT